MPQETETYSAETPFSEFLADTMSGASSVSEHFPEPPSTPSSSDAPGAPPVEPSAVAGSNPTPPDGTVVPDPAAVPDPNAPPAEPPTAIVPEPDPFKDATPLTYTVNGQQRTLDDIRVIPGVGAVIDASALPNLERRLVERDSLYERSQETYAQQQLFDRATAWTTQDANGRDQTITGLPAIQALQEAYVRTEMAKNAVIEVLKDPAQLIELLLSDGQGGVTINQRALENLVTRSENAEIKAVQMVQQRFAALQSPSAATTSRSVDVAASAPAIAAHYVQQYGQGKLTAEDTAFLAAQAPRYVRPVTPDDIQQNPLLRGETHVVDHAFQQLVEDRAALRASSAAAVSTASSVAAENARKLQAALLPNGKAPAPAPNSRPVTKPAPQPNQTAQDRDALFRNMERTAALAM